MAASKGAVKVEGVREVQRALKAMDASASDLKVAHLAVASKLVPGVTSRTPRRSGALAAGWKAGATKTRARMTNVEPYAGPVEYGWPAHKMEPARMVRDTVEASTRDILETYEDELGKLAKAADFEVKQ